jgi:hypothetical protein
MVDQIPIFVQKALLFASLDAGRLSQHCAASEDADTLRKMLKPAVSFQSVGL